ncbi:HET domain pin-c2 protein [Rutstroemia sp. NJR-2017a BBW]|nr:HET domain pin-c2 protein [Rutstroemia sp. NJR-2017a BBW]
MIMTTTANLGSRLLRIDESTLPITFRGLIILARVAGVPCITQDSPEDLKMEASLVGRVYSSASCTVAAAASAVIE